MVLLARGDSVEFLRAFGFADHPTPHLLTTESRFQLASLTKPFVSVAISRLIQDGKLSWEDPIGDFLPQLFSAPIRQQVRIKHLLTHTSGLREFEALPERARSMDDYVRAVAHAQRRGLAYEPGTRAVYTNANFLLLAKIIELRSGQPYFEYIRDVVFRPAGMSETGFDQSGYPPPHCCATSTARDLFRFASALQSGRLLDHSTVAVMFSDKPEAGRWGYGFEILDETLGIISHGGSWNNLSHSLEIFPKVDRTAIILSPRADGRSPLREQIREVLVAR